VLALKELSNAQQISLDLHFIGSALYSLAAVVDYALVGEPVAGGTSHVSKIASIARDTLVAVGVAILTVAVIDALWSKLGGDPLSAEILKLERLNELFSDAGKTGLFRVHSTVASSPKVSWEKSIDACKNNIDLAGYQLLDIVDSNSAMNSLKAKADSGVIVRILLPTQTMSGLPYAVSSLNLDAMKGNMTHATNKFKELRSRLNTQANFGLKLVNDTMILDASIRRFDDTMLVINYLHSINTSDSPLFEFRNNAREDSLFRTYEKWFDQTYKSGVLVT
jgi:hypothetical protein